MEHFLKPTFILLFALLFPALAEEPRPRVLILGDSIYQQPAGELRKAFGDRVEVVFPRFEPGDVRSSGFFLESIDKLLGEDKWDLIHFNAGLADLLHRAPGMRSFRVMPRKAGGVRNTDAKTYEANLTALVTRLKATGAKVVWASTTPIRASSSDVFELGSEIEYNAIAAKVMAAHKVPVNDMYTHVRGLINMDKPAGHGADPFFFDRKPIHEPMTLLIEDAFGVERDKIESK